MSGMSGHAQSAMVMPSRSTFIAFSLTMSCAIISGVKPCPAGSSMACRPLERFGSDPDFGSDGGVRWLPSG